MELGSVCLVYGTSPTCNARVAALLRRQLTHVYVHDGGTERSPAELVAHVDARFGPEALGALVAVVDGRNFDQILAPLSREDAQRSLMGIEQMEHSDAIIVAGGDFPSVRRWAQMLHPAADVLEETMPLPAHLRFDRRTTPFASRCYRAVKHFSTLTRDGVYALDEYATCFRARGGFSRSDWQVALRTWPTSLLRTFGRVSIGGRAMVCDQRGVGNLVLTEGDAAEVATELAFIGPSEVATTWCQALAKMARC